MSMSKISGAVLAAVAATAFTVAPVTVSAGTTNVMCTGINGCKGQSVCKTASNACKGQNACKGKGVISTTKADCEEKGGKVQ